MPQNSEMDAVRKPFGCSSNSSMTWSCESTNRNVFAAQNLRSKTCMQIRRRSRRKDIWG
ncbi:AAEL004695-PA [Aedes aegypti]|uniref:AAEL004695-PA n=1 Tax=Aedes aegypti TaxID=7159 RepID=Q0IFJ7_AEDAE|nr:AAEL004695-PA [Aedes aegypti]